MIGNAMLIAVGGFFGACARYGLGAWANKRFPSPMPLATLGINLSGSFLLGAIAGAGWGSAVYDLLGIGFMGAYTTFSTFSVENVQLIRDKAWKALFAYMGISSAGGIALACLGFILGGRIS